MLRVIFVTNWNFRNSETNIQNYHLRRSCRMIIVYRFFFFRTWFFTFFAFCLNCMVSPYELLRYSLGWEFTCGPEWMFLCKREWFSNIFCLFALFRTVSRDIEKLDSSTSEHLIFHKFWRLLKCQNIKSLIFVLNWFSAHF